MNRRGLFAAFALAPIMAVEAFAKEKPEGEPHSLQNSITLSGLQLCKRYYEKSSSSSNGKFLTTGSWIENNPNKQVTMAVGEDGNLWLKSKGGEWKRVVTE